MIEVNGFDVPFKGVFVLELAGANMASETLDFAQLFVSDIVPFQVAFLPGFVVAFGAIEPYQRAWVLVKIRMRF